MRMSDSINELAGALAKAQGELRGAAKDSANPHFKSRYADLASIWDACRAPLSKHGLAVIQGPASEEGGKVSVTTLLAHSSGQWIEDTVSAVPMKNDAQGVGSVITYLRRYALAAMAGVAPDDDDGEAAVGRPQARQQAQPQGSGILGQERAPLTPPAATVPDKGATKPPHALWYEKRIKELESPTITPAELEAWHAKHKDNIEKLRGDHPDMAMALIEIYNDKWKAPAYAA